MMDELAIEEMSIRAVQEKMDDAFRAAMQRAINGGRRARRDRCLERAMHSKPEGHFSLVAAAPAQQLWKLGDISRKSDDHVVQFAFRRTRFVGRQRGVVAIERRTIGAHIL